MPKLKDLKIENAFTGAQEMQALIHKLATKANDSALEKLSIHWAGAIYKTILQRT